MSNTIYWPGMMELPRCSYEVITELHGNHVKINCPKVVRWQEADGLAAYLKQYQERSGWVYTVHHMIQIEHAAKTGLPFRVLDFFHPTPEGEVELAAVMQVQGTEREFLYLNPFFQQIEQKPSIRIVGMSVH